MDHDVLNVLVVPFPYRVPPGSFQGAECESAPPERRWGRFQVIQRWLNPEGAGLPDQDASWSTPASRSDIVRFVDELLKAASRDDHGPVHGVVLPELALDWDTYDSLVRHERDRWPSIEFVVAGVSRDCNGRQGNQVTSSILHTVPNGRRIAETHSRRKHHRWQVDEGQIAQYGLAADLDPDVIWWEHLSLEERVLHVDVFREGSTMTAVICEDLARVDPGLALLRSLGPNLVFALLMDGPQRQSRWSGTYATALADDPGSSVLTLTSVGMVDRSNATSLKRKPGRAVRRTIGLWKNRAGPGSTTPAQDFLEIDLPDGDHAVLLRLSGSRAHETTMDGRPNTDTTAWYLKDTLSVGIEPDDLDRLGLGWIVDPG